MPGSVNRPPCSGCMRDDRLGHVPIRTLYIVCII
nr:MAG TPA: hypothetical protein [Bacteriophage sp.]